MMWILYALLAALFDGVKHIVAKRIIHKYNEYLLGFVTALTTALCSLPVLLYLGIPTISPEFVSALLITAIINAITVVLIFRALKHTDLSLITPLFALSPALLLITAPLLLGEFPSLLGLFGVAIILCGTYVLNFEKLNLKPFTAILKNKGQRLILLVTILWAISSNFYKIGMQSSSPLFFICILNVVIAALLFPRMYKHKATLQKDWKHIIPVGFLAAGTSIFQWSAVSLGLIVYALSIKRLSILISVLGGIILFKEKHSMQRIIAAVMCIVGVVLIII